MRKSILAISAVLLFCFAATLQAQITSCGSSIRNFNAALIATNISGDTDGFANVALTFDGSTATVRSSSLGLSNISSLSLYRGSPNAGGQSLMTFTDFTNNFSPSGTFTRTIGIDPSLAADI